ncbi:MAG TPA: hypothetical protein VMI92_09925 [Steroidobacteraceae bacterium]|nr:hypothetical protein [Steroidobacteraceae bacterium]
MKPQVNIAALLCLAALCHEVRADQSSGLPAPSVLEAEHAHIGTITVRAAEIFDTADPKENNWLFRTANRLHVDTHESAIRAQLLFKSGDVYSRKLLDETERNMRQLDFLREPKIIEVAYHDGLVDLLVFTHDVWTLQPGVSFSRSGGSNRSSIEYADQNLFGRGKSLQFGRSSDVERTSNYFDWRDPNVWGSHFRDSIDYTNSDDGYSWHVDAERPFFALATQLSGGINTGSSLSLIPRYQLGQVYDRYQVYTEQSQLEFGWRLPSSTHWTERMTYELRHDYTEFTLAPTGETLLPLPSDRKLNYPYLRYDLVEDEFHTTSNLNQIARTEDLHYGWSGGVGVGLASGVFGADRHAWLVDTTVLYGHEFSDRQSVFWELDWSGRREFQQWHNALSTLDLSYFYKTSANTRFIAHLNGDSIHLPDGDNWLDLGGDNGLRGYPLHYQQGDGRALITLEERLYTNYYLLQLLHVGAAVFFDAGRTWGANPAGTPQLGWLRDVGIGLRLGNSRTSFGNVVHIDLAAPLDVDGNITGARKISRLQLLIGTQASF